MCDPNAVLSLESSNVLLKKFAELTEWQRQQQEKLLQEQETQRELLSMEQRRIYEVFGLGNIDLKDPLNPLPVQEMPSAQQNELYQQVDEQIDAVGLSREETLMNKIHFQDEKSHLNKSTCQDADVDKREQPVKRSVFSFEDMPILPSPKKITSQFNFVHENANEVREKNTRAENLQSRPKRPFLRKGQGLARFRLNPNNQINVRKTKSQPLINKSNPSSDMNKINAATVEQSNRNDTKEMLKSSSHGSEPLLSCKPLSRQQSRNLSISFESCDNMASIQAKSNTNQENIQPVATWAHVLSKDQPPPNVQLEASFDRRKRELEELRVFEILEQQAANSSFCSTSSAIAQLMSKSVQSTPIKRFPLNHRTTEASPHVRFADRNEYKNCSYYSESESCIVLRDTGRSKESPIDGTASFDSQFNDKWVDEGKNSLQLDHLASEPPSDSDVEEIKYDQKKFQDSEAWSDGSSSSSGGEDTNESMSDSCVFDDNLSQTQRRKFNQQTCPPINSSNDTITDEDTIGKDSSYNLSDRMQAPYRSTYKNESELSDSKNLNVKQDNIYSETRCDMNDGSTYNSALLRTRLQELEQEIETFRRENASLSKLKRNHELEVVQYRKEKKEAEKLLKEEHENLKTFLNSERKKLAKEKLVFERYCKDLKNQPSKAEREEITSLKIQVEHLREELVKKDSRWSATQVRTRDRLKTLENENSDLKKQIQNLKRERQETRQFHAGLQSCGQTAKVSNTKVIHAINNHLGKIKSKDQLKKSVVIKNVVPTKPIPRSALTKLPPASSTKSSRNVNIRRIQSVPDMGPNSSFEDLSVIQPTNLSRSKSGIDACLQETNSSESESDGSELNLADQKTAAQLGKIRQTVYDTLYHSIPNLQLDHFNSRENEQFTETDQNSAHIVTSLEQTSEPSYSHKKPRSRSVIEERKKSSDMVQSSGVCKNQLQKTNTLQTYNDYSNHEHSRSTLEGIKTTFNDEVPEPVKDQSTSLFIEKNGNTPMEKLKPNGSREKIYGDGRREVWYPNGIVKKISPDKSIVKVIYNNGDVKETLMEDKTVKYYYAETRTWHTTYPDGIELLEFPDGQVERRTPSGTTDITFSNGCKRVYYADGRDEWIFPDGTLVNTNMTGEKIVQLSNGQREVHTHEHKRREYPDGTVKLIYPDGLQETRYANGRVRLRDKDGNLIMDSAAEM